MRYKIIKSNKQIQASVLKMAKKINKDYLNKEIYLINLNDSAKYLIQDLKKVLKPKTKIIKFKYENYKVNPNSDELRIIKDINYTLHNKEVIIADGVIISGLTHSYISKYLKLRMPKSLSIICVGIKKKFLKKKIPKCYSLFNFKNEWVEGYGFGSQKTKNKKILLDLR
jgi:hypoxanthine phosphoribosyltransferase